MVLGIIGSVVGAIGASRAAGREAAARNEAIEVQYEYDKELWEMKSDQLVANREYQIQEIQRAAAEDERIAAYKDASNLAQYNFDLQIRNQQQETNDKMFEKSENIYAGQMNMNALQQKAATDDELQKLREIHTESRFDKEEAYIDSIEAEGKLRARGVVGRSADKLAQSVAFNTGKKLTLINASLDNADAAADSALSQIGLDRSIADLNAMAARMLDPGELPMPVQPLATPRSTFIYPRELQDFDFGPEPVKGARVSSGASSIGIWGNTISGIAGMIGNYYGNKNAGFKN